MLELLVNHKVWARNFILYLQMYICSILIIFNFHGHLSMSRSKYKNGHVLHLILLYMTVFEGNLFRSTKLTLSQSDLIWKIYKGQIAKLYFLCILNRFVINRQQGWWTFQCKAFFLTARESNLFTGVCLSTRGLPSGGTLPGQIPLDKDPPFTLTSSGGHCSVRYASCWNGFLSLRYSKVVPESESLRQYLYCD